MSSCLPLRVTVFSSDIPFPPTRGGRADIWRRIVAMHRLGIRVQLICFYDDVPGKRPTDLHMREVLRVAEHLQCFPIFKGVWPTLKRLAKMARAPWHVLARTLQGAARSDLLHTIAHFDPELIWCEGPWCGIHARDSAKALNRPLIYRSHNIEHLYMPGQAKAARGMRDRIAWSIMCLGLRRFETQMVEAADWVFDISADDMVYWQSRGQQHISWLPPLAETAIAGAVPPARPEHDVVFLGNLTTPNNIRGVEWLIRDVRPLVLTLRPGTGFLIAGSNPGPFVRELCNVPGVTLLADVPDALAVYASARVLVNPVRTGSGTHVKVIEMLMMSVPIVSSHQGTQGLPAETKSIFRVADEATSFAAHIVAALETPTSEETDRHRARALFDLRGLEAALRALPGRLAARGGA